VAAVDGEFVCRRLKTKPKLCLVAENKGYKPIYINSQIDFEVTGLVTSVINQFT
jgi:DNA polymerase V